MHTSVAAIIVGRRIVCFEMPVFFTLGDPREVRGACVVAVPAIFNQLREDAARSQLFSVTVLVV